MKLYIEARVGVGVGVTSEITISPFADFIHHPTYVENIYIVHHAP